MNYAIPDILRTMMDRIPANQAELAARLSVRGRGGPKISQPQISRWLKGQDPERENYDRIIAVAEEIGIIGDVRSEDVAAATEPSPPRRVKVKGYVGAGSRAHFYALADEDYEEVMAPAEATDQTVAVEIKGSSWGPRMNSWLVFYDDVRSPVTDDLIGKTCVVGLADDRILIKEIQRNGRGGFKLLSNRTPDEDIEDAQIEWAAKVTSMRPR